MFPFPTKKQSTPGKKPVCVGCDESSSESSEKQQDSEPEIVEMPSSVNEESE